jgi:hypothetical protein
MVCGMAWFVQTLYASARPRVRDLRKQDEMAMKKFLLALIICSINNTHAQDTTCGIVWEQPIRLSTFTGGSPKIALSGDDTIHVIWRGGEAFRLPYRRSVNGGASFEPEREILTDSIRFPVLPNDRVFAVTPHHVYIVFAGGTWGGQLAPIHMTRSSDRGTTWDSVQILSPDTGLFTSSATTFGDSIVLIRDFRPSQDYGFERSTDDGATWSSVVDEQLDGFSRIALTPNTLHLANIVGVNGRPQIQYKRSYDLGTTWADSQFLSSVSGNSCLDPDIVAAPTDSGYRMFTAWRDNKYGCSGFIGCSIIGRQSVDTARTFLSEELLTEQPTGYSPKIAVRGQVIAVAWEAEEGADVIAYCRISKDGGQAWCPPTNLFPTAQTAVGLRVAVTSTTVHVVSHQTDTIGGQFYIFYRRGVLLPTSVKEGGTSLPHDFALAQNYPNPFNPSTTLSFDIGYSSFVILKVFDMLGREVATLVNEKKGPGEHSVEWNAEKMPSGVYFYRLMGEKHSLTRRMILIR